MNCDIMVHPELIPGAHDVFVSGDHDDANAIVMELLQTWGWSAPIDLGALSTARGTEMLLPIWIRLWQALGHTDFNFKIVRK